MNTLKNKTIRFENRTVYKIKSEIFHIVWKIVKKYEKIRESDYVNLILTDDDTIKLLNKKYLGRDFRTDVIAFPYDDDLIPFLGDIIIDVKTAEKQKNNLSLEEELQILFLHGLLHLLGYDHLAQKQKIEMINRQEKYIKLIKEHYSRDVI